MKINVIDQPMSILIDFPVIISLGKAIISIVNITLTLSDVLFNEKKDFFGL